MPGLTGGWRIFAEQLLGSIVSLMEHVENETISDRVHLLRNTIAIHPHTDLLVHDDACKFHKHVKKFYRKDFRNVRHILIDASQEKPQMW